MLEILRDSGNLCENSAAWTKQGSKQIEIEEADWSDALSLSLGSSCQQGSSRPSKPHNFSTIP